MLENQRDRRFEIPGLIPEKLDRRGTFALRIDFQKPVRFKECRIIPDASGRHEFGASQ